MTIYIEAIGVLAGVLNLVSSLPQIALLQKDHKARASIAKSRQALIVSSNIVWVVYGLELQAYAIILMCGVNVVLNSIILLQSYHSPKTSI